MKWMIAPIALSLFALSPHAFAEDNPAPAAEGDKKASGAFVVGAKVGAVLPFDGLNPMAGGVLEVGYVLPWLDRGLALLVDVGYTVPTQSKAAPSDVRIESGAYTWKLTQKELTIAPTVVYRFTKLGRVVPYVGVGPRVYLLESIVEGKAGAQPISPTTEQSTKVGFGAPLGVEFQLGPGALMGEFLFEWGPLNHVATGDGTSTLGGTIQVGYRFLI